MEMKIAAIAWAGIKKFNDFAGPATLNLIAFTTKIEV